MTEQIKRQLNATQSINDYIPAIIEAFVTFYGEKEREYITNKFRNLHIVAYTRPDQIGYLINQSNTEKSEKLIEEFLNKLTKDKEEQTKLKDILKYIPDLDYSTGLPLNDNDYLRHFEY